MIVNVKVFSLIGCAFNRKNEIKMDKKMSMNDKFETRFLLMNVEYHIKHLIMFFCASLDVFATNRNVQNIAIRAGLIR